MRRLIRSLLSRISALFQRNSGEEAPTVSNRFLVRFKPGIEADTRFSINAVYGVRQVDFIPAIDVQVLTVPGGKSLREMIRTYERNPNVEFAEPDYIAHIALTANDPHFQYQNSLHSISAVAAWDITTGSPDVTLAILDTGVTPTHEDLAERLIPGYDFVNDTDDPIDDNGHGTGVAGIMGAVTNNGKGMSGVTWQNPIMPVKVLDRNGSGNYSTIAKGIVYAADSGAGVINLSLGGSNGSSTLKRAVDHAWRKNAVVVAAAGNSNGPVLYPAAYPNVIAVAAVDEYDQRAGYSCYGPEVSVSAPGNNVLSTDRNGEYSTNTGTSFAAPMVAGLAGLILSVRPGLPPGHVREAIEKGAVDLGNPGRDDHYGWGRIDLANSLVLLKEPASPPPTEPPTGPLEFRGRVGDQENGPRVVHRFSINKAGRVEASLVWSFGFSNLDLYLYGPVGSLVAESTRSTFWNPREFISLNLSEPGPYTLAVVAASGQADYRLTVVRP